VLVFELWGCARFSYSNTFFCSCSDVDYWFVVKVVEIQFVILISCLSFWRSVKSFESLLFLVKGARRSLAIVYKGLSNHGVSKPKSRHTV
jgi:hypothetical protein